MRFSVLALSVLLLAGCKKERPPAVAEAPVSYPNGLVVQVLAKGFPDGTVPKSGDKITVHYVGKLDDGTIFDSSRAKDRPFSFWIGQKQVIEGWELGLVGMREGEIRKLTVPPSLGYGGIEKPGIPANSTLTFEVELIDVR